MKHPLNAAKAVKQSTSGGKVRVLGGLATMLAIATMAPALQSCATPKTSDGPHYWTIGDGGYKEISDFDNSRRIVVELADIVDTRSIAIEKADGAVTLTRKNLWGNPLDSMIGKSLAGDLNKIEPGRYTVTDAKIPGQNKLEVKVEKFQSGASGEFVFKGYALLRNGTGKILATKNFEAKGAQHGDGYEAMIKAAEDAISEAASQIAWMGKK